MTYRDFLDHCL